MRGQYGEMMSVDYSFMSTCCDSIVTEVSKTWRGWNLQGWSCNRAAGSSLTEMKDLQDLSVISEKKKAHALKERKFGCFHLLQLPHIYLFIYFFLTFIFYDHHCCPRVTGHIKAIQHFTFCFNSKFTCSFCLCTLCLSITLLSIFLVLSLTSLFRCPRNTQPGSNKKSGAYDYLLLTCHLTESPFTAYER